MKEKNIKKEQNTKNTVKRTMLAEVVRNTDQKTFVVKVEKKFPHPKYGKIVKTHKKYSIHNPESVAVEKGDIVEILEIAPVSKTKSWKLNKIEKKVNQI